MSAMEARRPTRPETAAERRIRQSADALCAAVERRMDDVIRLVEAETMLVREGKLFAIKELEPAKTKAARDFISGLEAVKKIRPGLERFAPDAIYRLRRRHSEFRSMLQLSLAALATAKAASDQMVRSISDNAAMDDDADSHDAI